MIKNANNLNIVSYIINNKNSDNRCNAAGAFLFEL